MVPVFPFQAMETIILLTTSQEQLQALLHALERSRQAVGMELAYRRAKYLFPEGGSGSSEENCSGNMSPNPTDLA